VRGRLRGRRFLLAVGLFLSLIAVLLGISAALAYLLIRTVPAALPESPAGQLLIAAVLGLVVFVLIVNSRSLARTVRRLEARDDHRRATLADLTHELRTSLAIIRGQAEAVSDGVYPADPDHLAPILEATRTLEELVGDLGNRVYAGDGSLPIRPEPTDVADLVDDSLAAFSGAAEQKGLSLTSELEPALPRIDLDPARIRGVLGNLLNNAIRHTPAGGSVVLAARRSGLDLELAVSDTGEGIPAELLQRVFERYVKGPSSTGTGLGLAIARDVVKAHGGRIEAESRPGHGTTIRLFLPLD